MESTNLPSVPSTIISKSDKTVISRLDALAETLNELRSLLSTLSGTFTAAVSVVGNQLSTALDANEKSIQQTRDEIKALAVAAFRQEFFDTMARSNEETKGTSAAVVNTLADMRKQLDALVETRSQQLETTQQKLDETVTTIANVYVRLDQTADNVTAAIAREFANIRTSLDRQFGEVKTSVAVTPAEVDTTYFTQQVSEIEAKQKAFFDGVTALLAKQQEALASLTSTVLDLEQKNDEQHKATRQLLITEKENDEHIG